MQGDFGTIRGHRPQSSHPTLEGITTEGQSDQGEQPQTSLEQMQQLDEQPKDCALETYNLVINLASQVEQL